MLTRKDFTRVYEEGERYSGEYFVFYFLETEGTGPRIGIVTPGSVGKAVERNRIRRVIREYFRKSKSDFDNLDFIVKSKKKASELDNSGLADKFVSDFRHAKRVVNNGQ